MIPVPIRNSYPKGYRLSLRDGKGWWITGDETSFPMVEKLAGIMRLKESDLGGLSRFIFSAEAVDGGSEWTGYDHRSIRIWLHQGLADAICEIRDNSDWETKFINLWYSTQPVYQRSMEAGGLPFHTGLAELNGHGVLFAAPGNQGKSTCCRRLPDYWKPLCDDESLVVLDKSGMYQAHPFPTWSEYLWNLSEKTWDVNYSVPLSAVFFLEQGDQDEVTPIGAGEAALFMNSSAVQVCRKFWWGIDKENRREQVNGIFHNACEMAKVIPAFRLRATLNGKFWEEVEKVLDQ